MADPNLTVLMAVRNGGLFLKTAVESILHQSYRDFTFLIIDDASTDQTREVISAYRDSRVSLFALERNIGQTAALNLGFKRATSRWIARMDADDYSAPSRLEQQMRLIERNPDVRCVGTGIWEFHDDPQAQDAIILRPKAHQAIWQAELMGSGMIHGSIVVDRKAVLDVGGYNESYRYASDRALFLKLLRRVEACNIQEPLVGLRRHGAQDSFSLKAAEEYLDVFKRALDEGGFSDTEVATLRRSLSYYHLFKARCLHQAGQRRQALRDWGCAFTLSPEVWLRDQISPLARRLLPQRLQARFRNKLMGARYENA